MKCFLHFLIFLPGILSSFSGDLRRIIKYHQCDPRCTFIHSEVSSKTIEFFPTCSEICGKLVFNENTDLSELEIKEALKSMHTLYGGILVENSNLKNLSFLTIGPDQQYFQFACITKRLIVRNNSKLVDSRMLWNIYYWLDIDHRECEIRVEDNELLDAEILCDYGYLHIASEMKVTGNLKNCGCAGNKISESSLHLFSNCRLILDGLNLQNISTPNDLSALSNISEIRGDISIKNSSIQNLSFFQKLETIKVSNVKFNEKLVIDIRDNPNMKRFAIPLLKEFPNIWKGYLFMNLENLHPDFCLTLEEMVLFLKSEVTFTNLHAKFCEDVGDLKGVKLCEFERMRSLEKNCEYIRGDVKIESGDEKLVSKLNLVTHIFGTLSISNTTLKNLDFLNGLMYMASMSDDLPVIKIISNKNMVEAYLPSMLNIITKGENYVIVHQNHPKLVYHGFKLYDSLYTSKPAYFGDKMGCPSDKFDILGFEFYSTCNFLVRGLKLNNMSIPSEIRHLSNIKAIDGEIEISNTNLEDLSFFENVKVISTEKFLRIGDLVVNIHHNPNMKRLGLKSLKKLPSIFTFTINLERLHPDFCLTINEMIVFLDTFTDFLHLDAKLCTADTLAETKPKTCEFSTMKDLELGCIHLIGDVALRSGDEKHATKLENTTTIFGTLSIENTNLEDLNFLDKLEKMANLNESTPLIQIINNKNLRTANLSRLSSTISKGFARSIIDGNDIFESTRDCMAFQYQTRTNVSYNGGTCSPPKMSSPSQTFAESHLEAACHRIAGDYGFRAISPGAIRKLTALLKMELVGMGQSTRLYTEIAGKTQPSLLDVKAMLKSKRIGLPDIMNFAKNSELKERKGLPIFPVPMENVLENILQAKIQNQDSAPIQKVGPSPTTSPKISPEISVDQKTPDRPSRMKNSTPKLDTSPLPNFEDLGLGDLGLSDSDDDEDAEDSEISRLEDSQSLQGSRILKTSSPDDNSTRSSEDSGFRSYMWSECLDGRSRDLDDVKIILKEFKEVTPGNLELQDDVRTSEDVVLENLDIQDAVRASEYVPKNQNLKKSEIPRIQEEVEDRHVKVILKKSEYPDAVRILKKSEYEILTKFGILQTSNPSKITGASQNSGDVTSERSGIQESSKNSDDVIFRSSRIQNNPGTSDSAQKVIPNFGVLHVVQKPSEDVRRSQKNLDSEKWITPKRLLNSNKMNLENLTQKSSGISIWNSNELQKTSTAENQGVQNSEAKDPKTPKEEEFKVKKIIDVYCYSDGKIRFETLWDVENSENTWESVDNFGGLSHPAIRNFLRNKENKMKYDLEKKKAAEMRNGQPKKMRKSGKHGMNEEFEVKKVCNIRSTKKKGTLKFEVEWYGGWKNTWEPLSSFGADGMNHQAIKEFMDIEENRKKFEELTSENLSRTVSESPPSVDQNQNPEEAENQNKTPTPVLKMFKLKIKFGQETLPTEQKQVLIDTSKLSTPIDNRAPLKIKLKIPMRESEDQDTLGDQKSEEGRKRKLDDNQEEGNIAKKMKMMD